VSKNYNGKAIFDDLNIAFHNYELNFLLGKNGVGKTTLFKCIMGLEDYSGNISVNREKLFCIYDDTPFYPDLSGYKNILLFKKIYQISGEIDIDYNLIDKDLLKKKVKTYSYGQRKKLAIMMVNIINPDIILLDEITNGLDYETIKYLKEQFISWKKNKIVVATGHQLDFYNSLVDQIFIIKNKTIYKLSSVQGSSLEEIYEECLE
jgi:ABC-2 type transport system ATP-binding protein